MSKKIIIATILALVFAGATAQTQVADASKVLARIAAAQPKKADMAFTQRKHTPLLTTDAVAHGRLTLNGERQMRWQYSDPTDMALVVSGDSIYTESGGKRRILGGAAGAPMKALAETMMGLTNGNGLTDGKTFGVELSEEDGLYKATLTPKRRDMKRMMQRIEVCFDHKNMAVRTVKLIEREGTYTLIEF